MNASFEDSLLKLPFRAASYVSASDYRAPLFIDKKRRNPSGSGVGLGVSPWSQQPEKSALYAAAIQGAVIAVWCQAADDFCKGKKALPDFAECTRNTITDLELKDFASLLDESRASASAEVEHLVAAAREILHIAEGTPDLSARSELIVDSIALKIRHYQTQPT